MKRGRGRKKGNHEARREEIADAAYNVILRVGFARASLAKIAGEIGYTTGVLRHYFSDKEELLLCAKNLLFDRSWKQAQSAAAQFTGIEKLRALATALVGTDKGSIDRNRLLTTFNGYAIGSPHLMKLQHKRHVRHWQFIERVIGALQADGTLPASLNARREARGITALVDGLAAQVIMDPEALAAEELTSLMSRHIDSLRDAPEEVKASSTPATTRRSQTVKKEGASSDQ